jgi:hypothetical protein
MARYNSVNSTGSIAQGGTVSSPYSGLLTTITTGSGTTNLPNPVLYAGSSQTFYNATVAAITLLTPSGVFTGPATGSANTLTLPAGSIITLVSDGTNYIAQDWLGGPASHTSITASGTITAQSTVTFNPSNANVSIQPTGTGTVTINPATAGTMDNVAIGATTATTGKFTTVTASGNVAIGQSTTTSYALTVFGTSGRFFDALGNTAQIRLAASEGGWASGYNWSANNGTVLGGFQGNGSGQAMSSLGMYVGAMTTPTMTLTPTQVGIGTTSPGATLDVAGTIRSTVSSGNNIVLEKATGGFLAFTQGGTLYGGIQSINASNGLQFYQGSNEAMRINSSGYVGIGNTSPQVALHIKTGGSSGTLSLSGNAANDTGGPSYILMGNTDSAGTTGPSMIVAANRSLQIGRGTSFSSSSGGTFTADFQTDGSGNVTSNPSSSTAPTTTINGKMAEFPVWNSTYNVAIGKRKNMGWNFTGTEYHTQKNQQATASTVGVFRVATDTANWMNTFIMIDIYSQYYSGGAVEKYYWSLAYGSDTLTQIYSAGNNQSTNFTITAWGSGTYVGNGAPAAYKYYDFSWQGGYYQSPSFVVTVCDSLALVSSITSSYQIQFL